MIPEEAAFAMAARRWGVTPWALEAALATDPRAFRWYLMGDDLADFEVALRKAGG